MSVRDRAVETGRSKGGLRGWIYRVLRRTQRPGKEPEDDRPVLVYIGDKAALQATERLAPWARVEPSGRGNGLIIGAGAVLNQTGYDRVRTLDSPRTERLLAGAEIDAVPTPEWLDFLSTCLAVGVATEADAARISGLPNVHVVGHPADQPEEAAALLDMLREEIS
jgi:hypothetical protein